MRVFIVVGDNVCSWLRRLLYTFGIDSGVLYLHSCYCLTELCLFILQEYPSLD